MIKINRLKLIEAMTTRLNIMQTEYDQAEKEYVAAFEPLKAQVLTALAETVATIERAREFKHLSFINASTYTSESSVPLNGIRWPSRPSRPGELEYIKAALKRLNLCAEDTLNLRDDDNYLRYI